MSLVSVLVGLNGGGLVTYFVEVRLRERAEADQFERLRALMAAELELIMKECTEMSEAGPLELSVNHCWVFSQVSELWADVDWNHGPHPYQACARRRFLALLPGLLCLGDASVSNLWHKMLRNLYSRSLDHPGESTE